MKGAVLIMKKINNVLKKVFVLFLNLIILFSLMCSCQTNQVQDSETDKASTNIADATDSTAIPQWKTAYLDFLETEKDTHISYALVYIDNDDIPELYLSGNCEATGDSICSYKNGVVIEQNLHRIGGGWYIEKSGNIINQNGHIGQLHTHAYKLNEAGFTLTLEALSSERAEYLGNDEYSFYYEYSIGNESANETEYNAALEDAFDFENAKRLNENEVEYKIIQQQIMEHS